MTVLVPVLKHLAQINWYSLALAPTLARAHIHVRASVGANAKL